MIHVTCSHGQQINFTTNNTAKVVHVYLDAHTWASHNVYVHWSVKVLFVFHFQYTLLVGHACLKMLCQLLCTSKIIIWILSLGEGCTASYTFIFILQHLLFCAMWTKLEDKRKERTLCQFQQHFFLCTQFWWLLSFAIILLLHWQELSLWHFSVFVLVIMYASLLGYLGCMGIVWWPSGSFCSEAVLESQAALATFFSSCFRIASFKACLAVIVGRLCGIWQVPDFLADCWLRGHHCLCFGRSSALIGWNGTKCCLFAR